MSFLFFLFCCFVSVHVNCEKPCYFERCSAHAKAYDKWKHTAAYKIIYLHYFFSKRLYFSHQKVVVVFIFLVTACITCALSYTSYKRAVTIFYQKTSKNCHHVWNCFFFRARLQEYVNAKRFFFSFYISIFMNNRILFFLFVLFFSFYKIGRTTTTILVLYRHNSGFPISGL